MCATARIMRSKSARSSRRERQGQAQAHRARPQPEGAGEGAPQDATAQGAQVREALSATGRSEEHTSELQSRLHLVCRLLLEKKKKNTNQQPQAMLEQR